MQASGYGLARVGPSDGFPSRRLIGAHRAAFHAFVGPIPTGLLVLHRCDVPLCIEPAHLWLGTQRDNVRDGMAKGHYRRPAKEVS